MSKISLNIKKRFVKDYNLPIKLFDDEIFAYYIDLYNKTHSTKYKYQLLEQAVIGLRGEDGFMREFHAIKDEIIADISSKESYKKLACDLIPNEYIAKHQIPKQNIYNRNFDGKYIMSIDLKKANYNSMKYYDTDLINHAKTYEEFISAYTALPYMQQSKQLRQVIFGNLLPKKQQSIQKGIIHQICDSILDNMDVKLATAGTDEILILDLDKTDDRVVDTHYLIELLDFIPSEFHDIIKLETFRLICVHPDKPFYAKISMGDIVFKNVPTVYYPQVYKHFFEIPLTDKDLLFEYEGERACFVKPLYHPSNYIKTYI